MLSLSRSTVAAVAGAACVAVSPATSLAQDLGAPLPRSWFALDADVSGMLRTADWSPYFHVRGRAGYSRVVNWRFWDATVTAEHLTSGRTAFGLMGSLTSISQGWSVSAGATLSTDARPGATVALGYAMVRVEAQVHFDEPTQVFIGLGLRIPLGAIAYAIWTPPLRYRMPRLR